MFKKIFLFILYIIPCVASAQLNADKIIATVGTELILWSDVESQYKLMESQMGGKMPEKARCAILDRLLTNAVLLVQAERDSVTVGEEEVDAQLNSRVEEILRYMGGNESQFISYYGFSPLEMKEKMREDMKKQLLVQKMQGQIAQGLSITPQEVKAFYGRIPKDSLPYFKSEIELAELVVKPKVSPAEDESTLRTATLVREQLLADTSRFCELAAYHSNDPGSAKQCGMIGITPRGNLVPEYESAAYTMDKNEISEPIKSEYGYHIIQLLARLGNNINTRHILFKPLINPEDKEKARLYLDSIRNLMVTYPDSFSFDKCIQRFSEETTSKSRNGDVVNPQTGESYFETGDLEPEVFFAVEKLKVGEISEVLEFPTPTGEIIYKIYKVRNRTQPHVASLKEDYARIQSAALSEKKSGYVNTWLLKKIPLHAVQLRFDAATDAFFGGCPILDKWKTSK